MMNKILQFIQENAHNEAVAESQVVKLSRKIQERVGLKELPAKLDFATGKYKIIKESRCFSSGWVDVLEIRLASGKTGWSVQRGGTAEINLPPQEHINAFFKELENCL